MKAAVLVEQNSPLRIVDVDIPDLDFGQVLVKVEYSGICGKQLEEISGKRGPDPFLPHLLGHEGSGVVVETGPGVTKVQAGDHVVLHWMKGSGIDSLPPRFDWQGSQVSAGWVTTFSEYTIVSENRLTAIEKNIPMDIASLLGCAVTTGLGIVFNNAGLMPGQSIAVFGVGGVGLNVVQGAKLVNAYPIVAFDVYQNKLDQALEFGATHAVNVANQDALSVITELSDGKGFDAVVDTTGNNETRQTAYHVTSNLGKTIYAGVPNLDDRITIDSFPLHFGRRIVGSHGGDTRPDTDIPRYLTLYKLGILKLAEQISHRVALRELNEAVGLVRNGEALRCIIYP